VVDGTKHQEGGARVEGGVDELGEGEREEEQGQAEEEDLAAVFISHGHFFC
jgi:hypothetical protein